MKKKNLAFTVELLGLFILLLLVITVVTQVFVMSRSHSLQARRLTEAVILAENAAEVSSTAEKTGDLSAALAEMDNLLEFDGKVYTSEDGDNGCLCVYAVQFKPESGSYYVVNVNREYEKNSAGILARDRIDVYSPVSAGADTQDVLGKERAEEPVYTLNTATFFNAAD